jgi:hypothetical protein
MNARTLRISPGQPSKLAVPGARSRPAPSLLEPIPGPAFRPPAHRTSASSRPPNGSGDDPLGYVKLLVSDGQDFSAISPAVVSGVRVERTRAGLTGGFDFTVGINTDGLIREVTRTESLAAKGGPITSTTYMLSDFGARVSIVAPPASDVQPGPPMPATS